MYLISDYPLDIGHYVSLRNSLSNNGLMLQSDAMLQNQTAD